MLIQLPCQAGGDNRIAQAWGHCQMVQSGTDVTVTEPPQHLTAAAVLALHPPPLSQKVLGECAFNASFCHTKPVLEPPRCCFRERPFLDGSAELIALSVIALSSWEEERWNEKARAGRKYRVCLGRARGALLVCAARGNPWSLLTLHIILWKAMALLAGGGRWHQHKW